MSGYRPQNQGNRSALRVGPKVSQRLKAAGVNVSPAARRYGHEGIFVAARGFSISVLVDFGIHHQKGRDAAKMIADIVRSWGLKPEMDEALHEESGSLSIFVRFDYPAPTPADRTPTATPGRAGSPDETAAPEGMAWMRVQATTVTAALASAGFWSSHGVTVEQVSTTAVRVRIADDAAEAVREGVPRALERKKYTLEPGDGSLIARKLKRAKRS